MRNIFVAASLADAALIANMLNENGIDSQTVEKLRGNIGSPYTEVWIVNNADRDRALKLIEQAQTESIEGDPWNCPRCDEENPQSFSICWKCGEQPSV